MGLRDSHVTVGPASSMGYVQTFGKFVHCSVQDASLHCQLTEKGVTATSPSPAQRRDIISHLQVLPVEKDLW